MSESSSSKRLVPPPLPSTSRPTVRSESHDDFIKTQIRSCLDHLKSCSLLSSSNLDRILQLLDNPSERRAANNQRDSPCPNCGRDYSSAEKEQRDRDGIGEDSEQAELGKRNKWFRETLSESSLLPTLVESALSIAAGPVLSDDQKSAISELIEMNQRSIAKALTDPRYQRSIRQSSTQGLIGTGNGLKKSWKGMGRGVEDLKEKRTREKEEKREKKKEEKILKRELKEERQRFRRERELKMSSSSSPAASSSSRNQPSQDPVVGGETETGSRIQKGGFSGSDSSSPHLVISPTQLSMSSARNESNVKNESFERILDSSLGSMGNSGVSSSNPISTSTSSQSQPIQSRDGTSIASINCQSLSKRDDSSLPDSTHQQIGGIEGLNSISTSSFSPWPGILITNLTLVSRNGDGELRRKWKDGELQDGDDEDDDDEDESGSNSMSDDSESEMEEDQDQEQALEEDTVNDKAAGASNNSRPLPSIPPKDQDRDQASTPASNLQDGSITDSVKPEAKDPQRSMNTSESNVPPASLHSQSRLTQPQSTASQPRPPTQVQDQPSREIQSSSNPVYMFPSSNAASTSSKVSDNPPRAQTQPQIEPRARPQPEYQPQPQSRPDTLPRVQDTTTTKQSSKSESAAKWAGRLKTVGKGIHDMI